MTDTPQPEVPAEDRAPTALDNTPEQPAEAVTPDAAPAPEVQGQTGATEEVHGRIVDAADRLVKAVEAIYDDTNLRGEVIQAKNELRDLIARIKGDVEGNQQTPPATGNPS